MTYSEQIKHPKWQKKRLEILNRDKFRCWCGEKEKTLHVHHRYYETGLKIWEYPDEALVTLCIDHHVEWHKDKLEIDKLISKKFHYDLDEIKEIIELLDEVPHIHIMYVKNYLHSMISMNKLYKEEVLSEYRIEQRRKDSNG